MGILFTDRENNENTKAEGNAQVSIAAVAVKGAAEGLQVWKVLLYMFCFY